MAVSEEFIFSIQALAKSASEQKELFPEFVNVADELVLNFGEVFDFIELSDFNEQQAQSLNGYILSVSGNKCPEIWETGALANSIEWAQIRGLARVVLKEFGWINCKVNMPASFKYIGSP